MSTREMGSTTIRCPVNEAIGAYQNLDNPPRADVLAMIKLYSKWQRINATVNALRNLDWYLSPEPEHISQILSKQGQDRSLGAIAKSYEKLGCEKVGSLWSGTEKIESMVEFLDKGNPLPPIIVVKGSRYPNSPDSSFIDGVHRSLASMLYTMRTNKEPALEMLVGEKESVVIRGLNRVAGILRS